MLKLSVSIILALNYSGRWDILNATKKIAQQVKDQEISIEDITESTYKAALSTAKFPDPDVWSTEFDKVLILRS